MFWNLPDDESSRVESIHDYQEREADEGRRLLVDRASSRNRVYLPRSDVVSSTGSLSYGGVVDTDLCFIDYLPIGA